MEKNGSFSNEACANEGNITIIKSLGHALR
jgi:hypothetical protein